ncbi:hypothetical protein [uncultured Aquimarina sp.]|uniref:hypothetical protein n=1 Tax=uncultured Aquimarina sp. TaxID=575652 RepID=UPI002605BCB4|nr:hypothetical protein [uncultured Aquimarina sp.]
MRKEYYDIYEILYADYLYELDLRERRRFTSEEYYLVRSIRRYIDLANRDEILRPDAKYFLLTNFHQMIIKPILESRYLLIDKSRKEGYFNLENDIQSDIKTIINKSKIQSNYSKKNEISGHVIMGTIDELWKELECTKLKVWG